MRVQKRRRVPPRVASLMKPDAPAACPGDRLSDVANRMGTCRVGAVAVMEGPRLAGIITERDLVRAVAEGLDPRATAVAQCMTRDPCTISADEVASTAAELMIELGVRHLPVVKEGAVVGVISARDLLHLGRPLPKELLTYEPW